MFDPLIEDWNHAFYKSKHKVRNRWFLGGGSPFRFTHSQSVRFTPIPVSLCVLGEITLNMYIIDYQFR